MEEKRMKFFEDIKARLSNCENNICHFDDLFLNLKDGSRMRCKCAQVTDGGDLIVTMLAANGDEVELWKEELDLIESPNAIWNAIHWPLPEKEVLEEIDMKMRVQPEMPYVFPTSFQVTLKDGNKFDVVKLEYLDEDCDTIDVTVYADYTGEIELPLDEFFPVDALQEISDNIQVPREIIVSLMTNDKEFVMFRKHVMNYITAEEMRDVLEKEFPAFDWAEDDELQFTFYPEKDNTDYYVFATCYEA